ncbi:MAG TPA: FUSC family protein [Caulobacteraceae bacterium]|jgi:hypothetical protein
MSLTDRHAAFAFLAGQPAYWREAALAAPAIPLLLFAGEATGRVPYAAVAAGAALCAGFGAARDYRGYRWAVMALVTLGMTMAAFAGCLAGLWAPALYAFAALAAIVCAALALVDEHLWWVTLQMSIALLIAEFYAGPPSAALLRAAAVFAGGAAQTLAVVALARLAPAAASPLPAPPPKAPPSRALLLGHTVRAAISVCAALAIARALHLANGYWAPMTALIVLKPGLSDTNTRGLARLAGTIGGGAAATLYAAAVGYSWPWLVAGVAVSATAAFALQKAHYAILTTAITFTVVALLSLAQGGGALVNAEHRLIATLIGGALALAVARIAPHRPLAAATEPDRVGGA